jgi:hypothetical protein
MLNAISASLLLSGLAASAGDAAAQDAKNLVGTWAVVSSDTTDTSGKKTPTFGPNPRGSLIFTGNGRYSLWLGSSSLPKIASNNRVKGTPQENQAVVAGSLAHFGKYTVDEKAKTFFLQVEHSTFANWDGTTQKRSITTLSGDELKYTNPSGSAGGGSVDLVWRRVK